jgi:peptidoglycan/xylan/chitin deacetylase (PgdA/CDA1 family)
MPIVSLLCHDVYRRDPRESGFAGRVADAYKITVAAFDAMLGEVAAETVRPFVTVPAGAVAASHTTSVAFTVDDGGESFHTLIADRLEQRGWRGHCFMTTGMIGQRGFLSVGQLRDLDRRGHVVGSHSVTHPNRFSTCTPARMLVEWTDSRKTLEDILGHAVTVASLPGGYFSPQVAETADEAGLRWLFTSEPEQRLRKTGACVLAGRYTVRNGQPSDFARRILGEDPRTRQREWVLWNVKKAVKPLIGPAYPLLGEWLRRREQVAPTHGHGGCK